jgi:hypothetical protein
MSADKFWRVLAFGLHLVAPTLECGSPVPPRKESHRNLNETHKVSMNEFLKNNSSAGSFCTHCVLVDTFRSLWEVVP